MTYTILAYLAPSAIFLYFILLYEGGNLQKKIKKTGDISEKIIAKIGEQNSIGTRLRHVSFLKWIRWNHGIKVH